MKEKKIFIVGIYGSGKSTLAKRLSTLLRIKSFELDDIKYKRRYDVIRPVKQRLEKVKYISNKISWIVEGSWTSYAIDLYKTADLIVFMNIPEWILYLRILYLRILTRFFKRQFDDYEYKDNNLSTTFKMMKTVYGYYHNTNQFINLESHKKYIQKYSKNVVIIKNNKDIEKLLE